MLGFIVVYISIDRQSSFVDVNTAIINTIVDLDNIMADFQGKLVFNFYVVVTAVDGRMYILNVNDLLAAVQVSLHYAPVAPV